VNQKEADAIDDVVLNACRNSDNYIHSERAVYQIVHLYLQSLVSEDAFEYNKEIHPDTRIINVPPNLVFTRGTGIEIAKQLWEEWLAEGVKLVSVSNYNIHFDMKSASGRMFPDWLDQRGE